MYQSLKSVNLPTVRISRQTLAIVETLCSKEFMLQTFEHEKQVRMGNGYTNFKSDLDDDLCS